MMKRAYWVPLLMVLAGLVLMMVVEQLDASVQRQARADAARTRLVELQTRLQDIFTEVVADTEFLARELSAHPEYLEALGPSALMAGFNPHPAVFSTSFTRHLTIIYAHPPIGNESNIGLDYTRRIEIAAAVRLAMEGRSTIIEGPVKLQQTDRPGLVVRTPFYDDRSQFLGIVNASIDMDELLELAGHRLHNSDFQLLIRAHRADQPGRDIMGSSEHFSQAGKGLMVNLAHNLDWELRAIPIPDQARLDRRADVIRLAGALIVLLLTVQVTRRTSVWRDVARAGRGISLYLTLTMAMLLPMLLLIGVFAGFAYYKIHRADVQLMQQQVAEMAAQLSESLSVFFDAPRQAASSVELFRQGILDINDPPSVINVFLSQLRVQPHLTFLSLGTTSGEYHAASRPPMGRDRSLRIQAATLETGRQMRLYWADDANQPSANWQRGAAHFDARTRHWYRQAQATGRLQWYPIYPYGSNDERGQYRGHGIGVSAPIFDDQRRFVGVLTADISLARISAFLQEKMRESGGTAFILEEDGRLVASSRDGPESFDDRQQAARVLAWQSDHPDLQAAGSTIAHADTGSGNRPLILSGKKHVLDWQALQLPDGPQLTLGVVLPRSWINTFSHQSLREIFYLSLLFTVLAALMALYVAYWLTQPLRRLDAWAHRLDAGDLQAARPARSHVREVSALMDTLNAMARRLGDYTADLERRVAERTRELAESNEKLAALSLTDPLTGIANRRQFDVMLNSQWVRACRNSETLGLLLIDIDYFKKYNDYYGHSDGDTTLKRVAGAIAGQVERRTDLVARYGGEEFIVVMPGCTLASALKKADQVRQAVMDLNIPHAGSHTGVVTISVGVVVEQGHPKSSVRALFERVDAALYQAKHAGRNQVRTVGRESGISTGAGPVGRPRRD